MAGAAPEPGPAPLCEAGYISYLTGALVSSSTKWGKND